MAKAAAAVGWTSVHTLTTWHIAAAQPLADDVYAAALENVHGFTIEAGETFTHALQRIHRAVLLVDSLAKKDGQKQHQG